MKKWVVVSALGFVVLVASGATAASLITSGDIQNGTIKKKDMSAKAITQLKGNAGPQGPQGARGPAGFSDVVIVESEHTLTPGDNTQSGEGRADCPSGYEVVGTGFNASVGGVAFVLSYQFFVGSFFYNDTSITYDVMVQAICSPAQASAARASRADRRAAIASFEAAQAQAAAERP